MLNISGRNGSHRPVYIFQVHELLTAMWFRFCSCCKKHIWTGLPVSVTGWTARVGVLPFTTNSIPSYPVSFGSSLRGLKWPERETDNLSPI